MVLVLRLLTRFTLGMVLTTAVFAQTAEQRVACEREFTPRSGQAGKDVVWVPTPDHLVTEMLKAVNTAASDIVYDLGAGDGKIAIAAAKEFGARAVGVEYNPKLVKLADCLIVAAGVADKVKMMHGDIFDIDFSNATVVTLYLLPYLNLKLRPTILKMKPGTRIVSHTFHMGDWAPDDRLLIHGADYVYFWTVPARVEGMWTLLSKDRDSRRNPIAVRFTQQYQTLEGVVVQGQRTTPIRNASMSGRQITFTFDGASGPLTAKGDVQEGQMEVSISNAQETASYVGKAIRSTN